MSRRKNSFSKAIRHLKEAPTNSTSGLYSVVPGKQTRTTTEVGPTQPDFSTVDFDVNNKIFYLLFIYLITIKSEIL